MNSTWLKESIYQKRVEENEEGDLNVHCGTRGHDSVLAGERGGCEVEWLRLSPEDESLKLI